MYSGALDGRPESAYRLSNSALSERGTVSITLQTSRNGWSAGTSALVKQAEHPILNPVHRRACS